MVRGKLVKNASVKREKRRLIKRIQEVKQLQDNNK